MNDVQLKSLFITHVEKEGPFLKVWGQTDKKPSVEVEHALLQATPHFENDNYLLKSNNLEVGILCCAKYTDEKYYRARISSITLLNEGLIEVNFIDYGNKDLVPQTNIRSIDCFNPTFISLPPLALPFVLAEAVCIGGEWNDQILARIHKDIHNIESSYIIVLQAVKHFLVKIFFEKIDLSLHLITQGFMQRTSIGTQEAVLLATMPRSILSTSVTPTLLSYKKFNLEAGSQHQVYVSYITDGPSHFFAQLKKYEVSLTQLMSDINSMPLKPLDEVPLPGTACLAKCLEDQNICRAVVTNEVDNEFKIFYVDFGNTEIVPLENLYQISFKYVIPKVMAVKLSIAGIDKATTTMDMLIAFKQFVNSRLLNMEILPSGSKVTLPNCRLWDPETNVDVRDVINKAAMTSFPEPITLSRGFTQIIRVSYVYSCNRFYVQLMSKALELTSLMVKLQEKCTSSNLIDLNIVKVGLPCAALFTGDGQWYRCLIVDAYQDGTVKVRYIDYGNEEVVPLEILRVIEGELLTVLRPQAIECSLNGYQNMAEDLERDNLFEELILEQEYTMKVVEIIGGKALVDLIDISSYNVGSLLLDKIATAKSQVSPVLVQTGNKVEHRKSARSEGSGTKYHSSHEKSDNSNWNVNKKQDRESRRPNFRRESSAVSSSDSEKSLNKGPRTSSRNDRQFERKLYKNNSFNTTVDDNSWNVTSLSDDFLSASSTDTFKLIEVAGQTKTVQITWYQSPSQFFCQLVHSESVINKLMDEIQTAYKSRKQSNAVVGAPVIALFPEDSVLYRARVVEVLNKEYRVYYVDFGNIAITTKVWPIENKFMELPAQAIKCQLNGLLSANGTWSHDVDSYFEKKAFISHFITYENDRYLVNLSEDGVDVGQQLVEAGLAISNAQMKSSFNQSILVGQQFRAMVRCINSLSDFKLLLQNGTFLNCSMHNLLTSTETYEDVLRDKLHQILIVYADDIVCQKLEVTLYDAQGKKLTIVNPDEDSLDNVEVLCPYLIQTISVDGYVSHVQENSVVIQPTENSDQIALLLESLFEYYENITVENTVIPNNEYVYAVKSIDGNWYRGRVTSFTNKSVCVTYVDYGNSEEVPVSDLRELAYEFMLWDSMAFLLNTDAPTEFFFEKNVTATLLFNEKGLHGTLVIKDETTIATADVLSKTVDERTTSVISNGVSEPYKAPKIDPEAYVGTKLSLEGTPAIVSHIDSPNDFYIQLCDALDAIDLLQDTLQKKVNNLVDMENRTVGGLCAAPYSVDQQWYRAQILDADEDITTVRFVDYGNTDVINNNYTKIKTLSPELLALDIYATKCALKIKPVEEEWSTQATKRFEEITADNVLVEFIDQDEKAVHYVNLFFNGQNVKNILLNEKLAVAEVCKSPASLTCFISHLNSPSEFWVQFENCVAELEWIAEQLSNAEKFKHLEDLTPGALCVAMFPDDQMWYRARILNITAGIEVQFIDYGNSCTCTNLKQLPEDLILLPPLAQKCSLQKPENIETWTHESIERFKNISADGQTVFNLKKITTGQTSIVELTANGKNITKTLLLPLFDHGYGTEDSTSENVGIETSYRRKSDTQTSDLNLLAGKMLDRTSIQEYDADFKQAHVKVGSTQKSALDSGNRSGIITEKKEIDFDITVKTEIVLDREKMLFKDISEGNIEIVSGFSELHQQDQNKILLKTSSSNSAITEIPLRNLKSDDNFDNNTYTLTAKEMHHPDDKTITDLTDYAINYEATYNMKLGKSRTEFKSTSKSFIDLSEEYNYRKYIDNQPKIRKMLDAQFLFDLVIGANEKRKVCICSNNVQEVLTSKASDAILNEDKTVVAVVTEDLNKTKNALVKNKILTSYGDKPAKWVTMASEVFDPELTGQSEDSNFVVQQIKQNNEYDPEDVIENENLIKLDKKLQHDTKLDQGINIIELINDSIKRSMEQNRTDGNIEFVQEISDNKECTRGVEASDLIFKTGDRQADIIFQTFEYLKGPITEDMAEITGVISKIPQSVDKGNLLKNIECTHVPCEVLENTKPIQHDKSLLGSDILKQKKNNETRGTPCDSSLSFHDSVTEADNLKLLENELKITNISDNYLQDGCKDISEESNPLTNESLDSIISNKSCDYNLTQEVVGDIQIFYEDKLLPGAALLKESLNNEGHSSFDVKIVKDIFVDKDQEYAEKYIDKCLSLSTQEEFYEIDNELGCATLNKLSDISELCEPTSPLIFKKISNISITQDTEKSKPIKQFSQVNDSLMIQALEPKLKITIPNDVFDKKNE